MLRAEGIDAVDVRECGLTGADDDAVLEHAVAEDRIIVTMDVRRFGNLIATPPATTPGLVVVRMPSLSTTLLSERVVRFLSATDETELAGALTILEPAGARRRR